MDLDRVHLEIKLLTGGFEDDEVCRSEKKINRKNLSYQCIVAIYYTVLPTTL